MKKTFFLLVVIFFAGCKLATTFSKSKIDNNFVFYALFYNNRTAKHKPKFFLVGVETLNTSRANFMSYSYYFSLDSNKVEKFIHKGSGENYILILDSTNVDGNENIFPVSQLESKIFQKVIYFSDSLKLKDFSFLKKAKGFKLITKN
jgi:hypothetical protein